MKAIIAAGGSGTRLRPLTFSSNKHLLPVANKSLLLYPLESILETGIKDIGVIVNQTRPAVESLLGDGSKWGVKITYIDQPEALGLAHVVKISEKFIDGSPFLYHLGDNIFTEGILRPFHKFSQTKADALVTMVEHEENYRLGVPYFDDQGNFTEYVEKPQNPPNKFGIPGLYFFSSNVFKAFRGDDAIKPSARGELEVGDLYNWLIRHGYKVETEEIDGRWMDPGKIDDMLSANNYLLDINTINLVEGALEDSEIEGVAIIGAGTRLVGCKVIGPVNIGQNCLIEDSIIGPHVSIADNTKLENCVVRKSIIMQDSSLMQVKVPIENSLIGKNTEVWGEKQESMSLFIGDHCKVRV